MPAAGVRDQPALHCLLAVLDTGRRTKALGSDRADRRQGVLDAMMKFPEDQLLQLVGGLPLFGVDPGLDEQGLGVDPGLFEQQSKAVVLRR